MKFLKKALIASAVTAASFGALSTASAATLQTDIDIDFPQVLILYGFDAISVTVDADFIGDIFTDADCGTGTDCRSGGADQLVTIDSANAGTVDVGLADGDLAAVTATGTLTFENSWGVRELGFTGFDATVTAVGALPAGITGVDTTDATGTTSGFTLVTGDITVDYDLDALTADPSFTVEIEVTGT